MNGLNQVNLIGNLCADPELRFTQSGAPVLNFRMAVNTRYKKEEEWIERAEFVNLVLWGKRGEGLAKFLTKGTPVYVDGELRSRSWEDKEGVKKYATEVNVNDIILLGGKRSGDNASNDAGSPSVGTDSGSGDDIPF